MAGSKIIDKSEAVGVDRWDFPPVDDSAAAELKGVAGKNAHLLTARQVDQLQTQAHDEAYQRGYEEGINEGRAEAASRIARLDAIGTALARPLKDLDQAVERDLLTLAATLAKHILKRELSADPTQILDSVRDCLELLPSSAREITIHVSPQDAKIVRENLAGESARSWRIAEDTALEAGNLKISSDSSQIDGTLDARLEEILASAVASLGSADNGT